MLLVSSSCQCRATMPAMRPVIGPAPNDPLAKLVGSEHGERAYQWIEPVLPRDGPRVEDSVEDSAEDGADSEAETTTGARSHLRVRKNYICLSRPLLDRRSPRQVEISVCASTPSVISGKTFPGFSRLFSTCCKSKSRPDGQPPARSIFPPVHKLIATLARQGDSDGSKI